MRLGGSLPRSIDAARLGKILRLTRPQINRLLKLLRESASEAWLKSTYEVEEFCGVLVDFIRTADGLSAYQMAAAEVDGKVSAWTLTVDGCLFRELTQHFFDNADFREIFREGEAADIGPDEVDAVGQYLADHEEWVRMSEFAWAVAVRAGDASLLKQAASKYDKLADEVAEIVAALEADDSDLAPETEAVAEAEAPEAAVEAAAEAGEVEGGAEAAAPASAAAPEQAGGGPEAAAPARAAAPEPQASAELEETVTALNQFRAQVNQLDANKLAPEVLDGLVAELGKLRQLAEILQHRRQAGPLLARLNEILGNYGQTIATAGAVPGIEAQRERISTPGRALGEVDAWLDGLEQRLQAITELDAEIQELMRQISVAAVDNDLAAIEQHSVAAQERKASREQSVVDLAQHLEQSAEDATAAPPSADELLDRDQNALQEADEGPAAAPEDRRRERREEVSDGTARFGGETYPLTDWSARGFCLEPCVTDHKIGDRLDVDVSVPIGDGRLEFNCRALVLRVDKERRQMAGIFATVDEETRQAIDNYFTAAPALTGARAFVERVKSTVRGTTTAG